MTGNLERAELGKEAVGPPSTVRLVELDLARGLAVFGMYAAHLAPDPAHGGASALFAELARGRSSALFAVLAGTTLAYLAGRPTPKVGAERVQALCGIAIRAIVLIVVGTLLTRMGTPIAVILPYYGLCLLLALPLTRLPTRTLVPIAVGSALVGPQLLYVLRDLAYGATGGHADWVRAVSAWDPASQVGGDGIVDLVITGNYPVPAWLPFLIVGMALGRLDLTAPATRARLLVLGPAIAVLGYGGSWLAFQLFPAIVWTTGAPSAWWSEAEITVVTHDPAWLLVAAPHTETTFATVGNAGVAISVIAAALVSLDRWPTVQRVAAPLIAVGSMSLSAYVGHLLAIELMGMEELDRRLPVLAAFMVTAAAGALVWRPFLGRGPLEYLMHAMTRPRPTAIDDGGR